MVAVWIVAAAAVVAVLLIWLCATGRIPRNPIAGIRIPSLFASDEAWRAGHRAALPMTILAAAIAVAVLVVALFVHAFVPVAVVVQLVLLIGGLIAGAGLASRAARRLR